MIGGEWAVLHSRWRHIGTHIVSFSSAWGRLAMGRSIPFLLGEFLIEVPPLAGSCLSLLFLQFNLTAYAAAGETSRAMRLAFFSASSRLPGGGRKNARVCAASS